MIVFQSVKGYKLFNCKSNDVGRRLDRVIKKMMPDVPAGLLYSAIRKGLIRVNEKKSNQAYRIAENDVIMVKESINSALDVLISPEPDSKMTTRLEELIVDRTENLIFLNKPAGLLTHGPESLAELLTAGLTGVEESLSFTPAPLHRLDRNTSGLIAASLSIRGASRFSELMREHRINKYYLGICLNGPEFRQRIEDNLVRNGTVTTISSNPASPGHRAVTTAVPLLSSGSFTLCLFKIDTGLTHQIRAQASAAGFPLAGDNKYGGAVSGFRGYFLHSWSMILPYYDEICGFRYVTAKLPARAMKKAAELFGTKAVDNALRIIQENISTAGDF